MNLKISPQNTEDNLSEEEQAAEGVEEADIIKYNQDIALFNTSDYIGKSKGLSLNYNKNIKLEFFKAVDGQDDVLIDTYIIDDVEKQLKDEIESNKKEYDRKIKKLDTPEKKDSNSTEEEDAAKTQKKKAEIEKQKEALADMLKVPKLKVSVELSRSGYLSITKATIGNRFLNATQARKEAQLNSEQLTEAQVRLRYYEQRDKDKIKRDIAMNDFESMVYKLREWLREEENFPYVKEEERETKIEELNGHEDWLYEDGATANHTTYTKMFRNLKATYVKYENRKQEHEARKMVEETAEATFKDYEEKTRDLAETKTWITKEERQDVLDKVEEVRVWLRLQMEEQNKLKLYEDPSLKLDDVTKKMTQIKKLFTKISGKKKPKPPKEEKKEEEKKEEEKKEDEKKEDEPKKEEEEVKKEEDTKTESEDPKTEDL